MYYSLKQNHYKALLLAGFSLMLLVVSQSSMAASTGGSNLPFASFFDNILDSITGPFAYGVSLIGIIASGSALIFGGDMNGFMRTLVFLVMVLSIVVAAKNTLAAITGKGAEITVISRELA